MFTPEAPNFRLTSRPNAHGRHRLELTAHKGRVILCVASYFKGNDFLDQCKAQGCYVVLLTLESLLAKPWVREHDRRGLRAAVVRRPARTWSTRSAYLARTRDFSRIAPLDDYDVEIAAHLREHLRIPGMGETTARYFRDKLAMRAARQRSRHRHPRVRPRAEPRTDPPLPRSASRRPWLLKPRAEARAVGIKKFDRAEELWPAIEELGDAASTT